MEKGVDYRINKSTGWLIIGVAALFDIAQAAAKLFLFIGLTLIGAAIGAWFGSYIGAPNFGAWIGGMLGTIATFLGFASGVGILAGAFLSELIGWIFIFFGYAIVGFWLATRGVYPLSGNQIEKKALATFILAIIDLVPFLNIAPGLTLWAIVMIRISREEDEKKAKEETEHRGRKRMRRTYIQDQTEEYHV